MAGLPGAPVRVVQVAYLNPTEFATGGAPAIAGRPAVLRLPLGFAVLAQQPQIEFLQSRAAPVIMSSVIGGGTSSASPAQQAAEAGLLQAAGLPVAQLASMGSVYKPPAPGSPVYAAATRFAALPAAARHAWLLAHLAALREARSPWSSCRDRRGSLGRFRPVALTHPSLPATFSLQVLERCCESNGTDRG